jgi:serine/threonine protein kinase
MELTSGQLQATGDVHELGIAHRDIKVDNFCFKVTDTFQGLALVDFGSSLRLNSEPHFG